MKRLLSLSFIVMIAVAVWAAKANTWPVTVMQPDGTTVTVRLFGDENFSWNATPDGALLVHIGNTYYIAAIDNNGNLSATTQLAHEPAQRSNAEVALIANQDKSAFFAQVRQTAANVKMRREPIGTTTPSYFPHTGNPKAIVLLVEFSDVKFTVANPKATFDDYLNGTEHPLNGNGNTENGQNRNVGSVSEYFKDMSFGQFTPQFDVYAPIRLPQTMAYYGANSGPIYDKNNNIVSWQTKDVRYSQLIPDAIAAANAQLSTPINYTEYKDNNGNVQLVYIIYAGYGESNGAPANTLWPKSWAGPIATNGITISRVGINNELNYTPTTVGVTTPLINGIGLFCHEFSHTMGMADMYPYDVTTCADNQEMEYWDLMDGGEYCINGYYPAPYTAWEREAMGWMSLTPLTTYTTVTNLKSVNDDGQAYKIVNPADTKEYLVLENVQQTGWGQGLPGHGLLVYHVKWPSATVNMLDHPNQIVGKPGMAVVPANKLLLAMANATSYDEYITNQAGNTFPGTSNVTELTYAQALPNYKWYTGSTEVKQLLRNITEDLTANTVSFDYLQDITDGISNFPTVDNNVKDNKIYTIDGRFVGTSISVLPKGIYIMNGKKVVK